MTWPNVMVTNYLRETDQVTPEIDAKARAMVNEGYQLILTFESESEPGGFNWWGDQDPGNVVLTAAGMQILEDMDGIVSVDRAVIDRAHAWMEGKQSGDGSWDFRSSTHSDISHLTQDATRATAYVVWSMADTGYQGPALGRGLTYLKSQVAQVEETYTLALIANALVSAAPNDPALAPALGRLEELKSTEGQLVYWATATGSVVGSHGEGADVETTALATLALVRAGVYPASVQGAINWMASKKDTFGQWGSTQATVLALRAMLASLGSGGEHADASVTVKVDDVVVDELPIDDFNKDVMHLVDLRDLTGEGRHDITVDFEGEGNLFYQVVQVHFLPWEMVGEQPEGPLSVSVTYDRTNLEVEGVATGTVTVKNRDAELSDMVMVELGLPPGFDLDATPLNEAVADGRLQRYETRPRLIVCYLMGLTPGEDRVFTYRLVARNPVQAEIPRSRVYSYYNPEVEAFSPPVEVVVE